jgi:serine/threonine protein kinase
MKSATLHGKAMSDKALCCLVECMLQALKHLYSLGLSHLDLRPANILEQNKDSLNMCYKLLFTNYTVDAVIQLKNLDTNI